jgi:hypothetical protein
MPDKDQIASDAQPNDGVDLRAVAVQLGGLPRRVAGNVARSGVNFLLRDAPATNLAAHRRDAQETSKKVRQDMGFTVQLDAESDAHVPIAHSMAEMHEFRDTTQPSLGLTGDIRCHLEELTVIRVRRSTV